MKPTLGTPIVAGVLLAACATPVPATSPSAPIPYSQEAGELMRACRYEEARPLLEARLANAAGDERIATLLQLGSLEEHDGNLTQAVPRYRAAVADTRPDTGLHATANLMLGMASARLRDHGAAIETLTVARQYRRPLAGFGDDASEQISFGWAAHAALGVALAESGRFAEAVAQFKSGVALATDRSLTQTRLLLESWQQTAEQALQQDRRPAPDSFWKAAYGNDATLAVKSTDFELVPRVRRFPAYPRDALRRGVTGHVDVELTIDEHGKPIDIKVIESVPARVFDRAAVTALREWRFEPRIENCRAVPATGIQRVDFHVLPR